MTDEHPAPTAAPTEAPTAAAEPTDRAGKYQRSAAGLVVSLVVTVLAVGGLLWFMGIFRNDLEVKPDEVDYLETVASLQRSGVNPVYPSSLPEGWIATGVDFVREDDNAFGIRMLTDDQKFVGVRQEESSSTAMLATWVDDAPAHAAPYRVPSSVQHPVGRLWEGWKDAGGDSAYSTKVGKTTILVFGSATPEELRGIVDSLVTRPVER